MAPKIRYSQQTGERRELSSLAINPALKYLSKKAAREEGRSWSSFVEDAIRQALEARRLNEKEPYSTYYPPHLPYPKKEQ